MSREHKLKQSSRDPLNPVCNRGFNIELMILSLGIVSSILNRDTIILRALLIRNTKCKLLDKAISAVTHALLFGVTH